MPSLSYMRSDTNLFRTGTANMILEAKEKERSKDEKGKEKERPRKKAKRYVATEMATTSNLPFVNKIQVVFVVGIRFRL